MKYSLKQLAVFDAVASLGSVSLAADHLSLTQSATSMSLSQLEKLLGQPLFERNGNRLLLSHWGQWLRPKAKHLLSDAQEIERGFVGQQLISGDIDLGTSQTAAEHLVPKLISKIDRDFPEVRVNIKVQNSGCILQGVINHQYQLGIIEGRCDDSRLTQATWCYDHLVIVSSSHHPYASYEHISLAQLEQASWVLREHGAGTREIFDTAIHGLIDRLDVRHEYEQVSILQALVEDGPYISCLPYFDVASKVAEGRLTCLSVPELDMRRRLSFVWRSDSPDHPIRECLMLEAKRLQRQNKHQ
ncbi:LysR substrate-binding domain-containing protein [Pelagibaculum spongiae]|uniref:LysR family transcriptional regulator n=1 Tax=Pelagibaculum spongiae TaxID=2080658 RepID=A0A2V1GQN2_9GAMM|nr:LysR substrate-binding domain-containing protein [Pelagibaculum spongiae]PVZ65498.1 LysR family transcriptional regulator [Pelagibaculum spongiae]